MVVDLQVVIYRVSSHFYLVTRVFDLFLPHTKMAPTKSNKSASATAAKTASVKKEKVHHPSSRKAEQLNRKAVRKGKMGNLTKERKEKVHTLGMST